MVRRFRRIGFAPPRDLIEREQRRRCGRFAGEVPLALPFIFDRAGDGTVFENATPVELEFEQVERSK